MSQSKFVAVNRYPLASILSRRTGRAGVCALIFVALTSCSISTLQHPAFEKNKKEPEAFPVDLGDTTLGPDSVEEEVLPGGNQAQEPSTRIEQTPTVDPDTRVANRELAEAIPDLAGPAVLVNYNNLPLSAFIHEVFGEQLDLSYTLDPQLSNQQDLVTLRLTDEVTPSELYRIAKNTLRTYGVVISQDQGLLTFGIDSTSTGGETPLLVSGRALPDVPDTMRPIFMFVPLNVVSNAKVKIWLETVLRGQSIVIAQDSIRNAIVLQGNVTQVEQALSMIKSMDQPLMRGKFSTSIEPAFMNVTELANNLDKILRSEGYDSALNPPLGAVILLPLEGSNTLIAFAPTQEIIDHIKEWATTIDRRQQLSVDEGIFSYEAASTRADHIVEMLNQLDSGGSGTAALGAVINSSSPSAAVGVTEAASAVTPGRFVVDQNRNAILFKGSGQEWLDLLPVIKKMDKPAPSVLIEVLIAEVTLNDQDVSGIEWLANGSIDIDGRSYTTSAGTLNGLNIGTNGFNLTLNRAGQTRAVLNAFYRNQRAEIRSRPRLMVKSGETASIDIGNEIPVVTSTSRSVENPNAPLVQNVQYRTTGLTLTITPVVHTSGYVDIEISQSLSESRMTTTSSIDSPTIFNRQLDTVVTLRDGGSILLGGLVSSSGGTDDRGVPLLGKLPVVGKLFRTDSETQDRTELMMLVVPYVLRDPKESAELQKRMAAGLAN